jgi:hypothetical protein
MEKPFGLSKPLASLSLSLSALTAPQSPPPSLKLYNIQQSYGRSVRMKPNSWMHSSTGLDRMMKLLCILYRTQMMSYLY